MSCKPKEAKVDAIFVGPQTVCAQLSNRETRCDGAMTNETTQRFKENAFEPEPGLFGVSSIALGNNDGCALNVGIVSCFGFHFGGSPGAPRAVMTDVDMLASVGDFFCVRSGATREGKCFAPPSTPNDALVHAHVSDVIALAAGGGSACFVSRDETAHCFFTTEGVTLEHVTKVATWNDRACGIRANGDVECAIKTDVLGGKAKGVVARGAKDITLDANGMCILQHSGTLACEEQGALTPIQGVFSVKMLAAAGADRCFVNADHVAFCWGKNEFSEFGTKSAVARDVPAPIFFPEKLDPK
jgi:hypothetical protein